LNCHGCDGYRPAQLKRFHEMGDDAVELATIDELRLAYKDLRAHHVEETTALVTKLSTLHAKHAAERAKP
jgi:hypothetical protein